jgi:ubiquitin carboxyl-terminal hydrolase 9/24
MDDEQMINQCFGGDYTGEVYDNIMKRMAYKKQKRWWNAYIILYQRLTKQEASQLKHHHHLKKNIKPNDDLSGGVESTPLISTVHNKNKIPFFVLKSVCKKNIKFLHHRHHFSIEYFQFIKKLCQTNLIQIVDAQQSQQSNETELQLSIEKENICMLSVELAVKFLFSVGFRVKKTLRGPINEWYEILLNYIKFSSKVRQWMAKFFLIDDSLSIVQYLIECPVNEIRNMMSRLLLALVHYTNEKDSSTPLKVHCPFNNNSIQSIAVLVDHSAAATGQLDDSNSIVRSINTSDSIIQTVSNHFFYFLFQIFKIFDLNFLIWLSVNCEFQVFGQKKIFSILKSYIIR